MERLKVAENCFLSTVSSSHSFTTSKWVVNITPDINVEGCCNLVAWDVIRYVSRKFANLTSRLKLDNFFILPSAFWRISQPNHLLMDDTRQTRCVLRLSERSIRENAMNKTGVWIVFSECARGCACECSHCLPRQIRRIGGQGVWTFRMKLLSVRPRQLTRKFYHVTGHVAGYRTAKKQTGIMIIISVATTDVTVMASGFCAWMFVCLSPWLSAWMCASSPTTKKKKQGED